MTVRGFTFDGFLLALAVVVIAAILAPAPGASHGFLHVDWIATYGIAVVFFLYGLTLAPERLREGASNWRLHLTVQLSTFVLFPVVVLLMLRLFGGLLRLFDGLVDVRLRGLDGILGGRLGAGERLAVGGGLCGRAVGRRAAARAREARPGGAVDRPR